MIFGKKILSRLSTQIQQTFQSFYGFCVNLSIKYIVRLGYINIIVCSAEAMAEICNIDELNVWIDDCECKAWNDFFSYPDLLVIGGCMVLYDIVPDFIQFMLTLSFKIRYKGNLNNSIYFSTCCLSAMLFVVCLVFEVDGMMEYNV